MYSGLVIVIIKSVQRMHIRKENRKISFGKII
jgi:hypothetical protein